MILFLISVILGTICFLLLGFIVYPLYRIIRDTLRIILYYVGIDTLTKEDKIFIGEIEPDTLTSPTFNKRQIVPNCILSKASFPNISKYVPDYVEEIVEDRLPVAVTKSSYCGTERKLFYRVPKKSFYRTKKEKFYS